MTNCQCKKFSFCDKLSGEKNQFGTICAYHYSVHILFNPLIPMTMENKFEGLLSEGEMNEIKNLLQSKDNFELVMIRRGIIQVCADIEYHFGIFGVDYFFGALDIELAKRNVYDFAKCTFINAVDNNAFENRVRAYQKMQQKKHELEFFEGLYNYLKNH